MAPRKKTVTDDHQNQETAEEGMFRGMVIYLVRHGVQPRRLQIWKQKLLQMGAKIEDNLSKRITHILALSSNKVLQEFDHERLKCFEGNILRYEWLENSLKSAEKLSTSPYMLELVSEREGETRKSLDEENSQSTKENHSDDESAPSKKARFSKEFSKFDMSKCKEDQTRDASDTSQKDAVTSAEKGQTDPVCTYSSSGAGKPCRDILDASREELSLQYNPPDMNRSITEIFGKLINIYRALGDDRRSFSYYKAIPVIEKLPFKIESVDQLKDLPAIGKSMQDHILEIVTTGKLSKLEHFESDEKVRTVSLFGEVWGIGPATALKLYEKGYRTLSDLEKEDSLTHAQRLGLQYFDDIKKRIPRNEVKEMELLLQKSAEFVLPGVVVVCGGSYRRGKSSCGDLDIIITHPDGRSHKGFLPKYIQYLKEINFLREDLVFSIHSVEGTDSGVDTYFGLCTYPGREQRHRIDFKGYLQGDGDGSDQREE